MQLNSFILIFQIIALITAKRTGKYEEKFKSSFKSTVVELYFELCLCFWIMVRSAGENFFDVFSAGDYVSFIFDKLVNTKLLALPKLLKDKRILSLFNRMKKDQNNLFQRKILITPTLYFVNKS